MHFNQYLFTFQNELNLVDLTVQVGQNYYIKNEWKLKD